jgi:NAD(P)H-nitrite reductase large subunit
MIDEGEIASNVLNFFGRVAFSAGLVAPTNGNNFQILKEIDNKTNRFKKLIFEENKLVGAMFFGIAVDPGVIVYLIRKRVDIGHHKDSLFDEPQEVSRWLMLDNEKKGGR